MNEKEFINRIESLKSIKPDAKWASLTRDEILGGRKLFSVEGSFAGLFSKAQVFAMATALVLFGGVFLYSHLLTSRDQRIAEEAEKMAKQSEIQLLSVALTDFKKTRTEMRQSFAESLTSKSEEEIVRISKDVAPLLLEIDEKEEVITRSFGVMMNLKEISPNDEVSPKKGVAFYLIADLEKRSLTEEAELLLAEAKEAFESGNYRKALRKVLEVGENQKERRELDN